MTRPVRCRGENNNTDSKRLSIIRKMSALVIPRYDSNCALCRKLEADKTGSHLVPNFLIHGTFSFDGKGPRDREIARRTHLNMNEEWNYYGSSVSPEAIRADLGRDLSDDELEKNRNLLECDYLFCSNCEKRFGVVEDAYAPFYRGTVKVVNSRVAYLFWLSVFWRMQVGHMSIFMSGEDEFAIREILDRSLLSKDEICSSEDDLGDFGYVLWRCKDVKKGDSGIFGTRTQHSPYMIIVGELVVLLYAGISKLERNIHYAGWTIEPDSFNTYHDEDVLETEIELEDFARLKRFVIDESKKAYGPKREEVELDIREQERSMGRLHAVPYAKERLQQAISEDRKEGKPFYARNSYRFEMAELKMVAAQREGKEYDFLKDRSLMLFPFDVDNYKADLLEIDKLGYDISMYPMVQVFMPKRYWVKKRYYEERMKMINRSLDELYENGYTYDDIMLDNMRTNSSLL